MSVNSGKWLCIGGSESGKWIDQKEFHEVHPYNTPLRPHIYRPEQLINPYTNQKETFYVLSDLSKDRYEYALNLALENQLGSSK
ncbi:MULTISPECIES: hypothetical protein [Acinetobacter calcoaceticus/baumannii complex]|uniref:hypothetical protein n=1 Tax=Acinetobacter calcoaceticus/baumannii complex TaxID=909768 RepID=UPI00037972E5|nr:MULTISPECIES: hypothetical protein [Acinetobacter calcoaceticus/baumannii complex]AWO16102.1 hypothetical protein DLD53_07640 [Acinetobacter baumannii]EKU7312844.1 hypothetical protein [Acinetobacter baumannii]ELY0556439.1 hypothetical protein [Acinetobacter baumannii]ELY1733856.1 hypothetical protein [Acinetobacter baumannii]EMB9899826.1 hypothetical protein [Acinetobacter baumannii]